MDPTHLGIDASHFTAPLADDTAMAAALARLLPLRQQLALVREQGHTAGHPFFALPFADSLALCQVWGERIRDSAEELVVLGIGGSSLGAEMLVAALGDGGLPVRFVDNVDPHTLAPLATLAWSRRFLLAVSKSGETAETLAQLLTLLPFVEEQLGPRLKERVAVITGNPDGALAAIATALELPIIPHAEVGGRFSVLSATGLIPAAAAGVALEPLLEGARAMAGRCLDGWPEGGAADLAHNPAFVMGAAQYLLARAGYAQSVQFAYGDRLGKAATWYGQLWAESLGKRDRQGNHTGLTPIAARGVTDQHSQLQLYLDGPRDKQFTLLLDSTLASHGHVVADPRFRELPAVAPLYGHTTGALFQAEFQGTRDSLAAAGLPLRTLSLDAGDAAALGELIILLQTETAVVAELLQIDPYDQPAVEDSKRRTRACLAAGDSRAPSSTRPQE